VAKNLRRAEDRNAQNLKSLARILLRMSGL